MARTQIRNSSFPRQWRNHEYTFFRLRPLLCFRAYHNVAQTALFHGLHTTDCNAPKIHEYILQYIGAPRKKKSATKKKQGKKLQNQ